MNARDVQAPAVQRVRKTIAQPTPPSADVPVTAQPAPAENPGKSALINQDAETEPSDAAVDVVTRSPTLPTLAASSGDTPPSATTGYSEEQSATETESQEEMPLIWPVLTSQELAALEPSPPRFGPIAQLAAALAAVLGLSALIFRLVFRPARSVPRAPRVGARWDLDNRSKLARNARRRTRDQAADNELQGLLRELQRRSHVRSRRTAA